jgi:hypothetical protein
MPASSRRASQRTLLAAAAIAAVAVAVVIVVVMSGGDDDPRPDDLAGDPGVSHVHGLGVNPTDGSLIVATHYGSFRIAADSDEAERIGESFQDTMGFTVVGPDRFYGSGHPDVAGMQAGQPGLLGLIESVDAGESWSNVSLSGRVDFHALAFAHDHVYGWDSGTQRFMVSADGREWEARSTLAMYGFAVDPDDADHIMAATPEGLVESNDGGRTWSDLAGPALLTLSWDADAGLWGADSSGVVFQHEDGDWTQPGALPGSPQAFLATGDGLYAAAHDADGVTAIYQSTDGGVTWDLRYRDPEQQ